MKPQAQHTKTLGADPLDGDTLLERFYRPHENDNERDKADAQQTPAKVIKEKPTHYKVVCISLYNEDIERLEDLVAELKRRGHTKANKSQLIRAALAQVDLAKIPKGF